MFASSTRSFADAVPVVKIVDEKVVIHVETRLPRVSVTVTGPSCPAADEAPVATVFNATVETGTVIANAPLVMVNVAVVSAALAAGARAKNPTAMSVALVSALRSFKVIPPG